MFGTTKQQAPQSNPTDKTPAEKPSGTSYDLVRVTVGEGGKKTFTNVGTVFIRSNGTGGVLYTKDDSGQKLELAIFAKKPRATKAA